jgi:hypothetical protein
MGAKNGKMKRKTSADYFLDKDIAGTKSSFSALSFIPLELI